MRSFILIFVSTLIFSVFAQADIVVTASPTVAVTTVGASAPATVQVPEIAAPPKWAIDLMQTAQEMPVVGPILTKILLYLGIIGAILTSLIAFLLTSIRALSAVMNLAGLVGFAQKLEVFQNGPVMYWLKYFSMFNAKKQQDKVVVKTEPKAAA